MFLSHHISPQAAPVCCEYKCQNTQCVVKHRVSLRQQFPVKSTTDRIWLFTDFGSKKVVWGDGFKFIAHTCNLAWDASIGYRFDADGVLSCLSVCQPQRSMLPLGFTGNVELVMSRLLKLSLLHFVYCFTDALSTAGKKCFFISSAETQCVSDELSLLLRGFTSFRCCVCRC